MLFASNNAGLGALSLRTHIAVERDVRIYAVGRSGMRSDTRYVAASGAKPRDFTVLWLILEGSAQISTDSQTVDVSAPALLQLPEPWVEGAKGVRCARLKTSETHRAFRILHRMPCSFEVLGLDAPLLAAATDYHDAILGADPASATECILHATSLLRALARSGFLPSSVDPEIVSRPEDASLVRVWSALQERYAELDMSASLKVMAASCGLSPRHTARMIAEIFRDFLMPPGGYREAATSLRLGLASMLLSIPALSVGQVASLLGYSHPESMTNAFQRANLPPPHLVRSGLLGEAAR